jgi:hypothetical protein
MRISRTLVILGVACVVTVVAPREAAAQGFFNPFIGATLSSPSPLGGRSQPGFGVALGSIGLIFGGDFEFAYFPQVIDNQPNGLSQSRAITIAASTLIGPRIGPVKVYAAFGGGDTILSSAPLSTLTNPSPSSLSSHYFTLNSGGGLIVFFAGRLGMRGDVRYLRAYGFSDGTQGTSVGFNHFNFWRGTLGLAVKF